MGRKKKNPWNCMRMRRMYEYIHSNVTVKDAEIARQCEKLAGVFSVGGSYLVWHNFISRLKPTGKYSMASTSLENLYVLAAVCAGITEAEDMFTRSDIKIDGIKVVNFDGKAALHSHLFRILAILHADVESKVTIGRLGRIRLEWKGIKYIGDNLLSQDFKKGMIRNAAGIGKLRSRDIAIDLAENFNTTDADTLGYLEALISEHFCKSSISVDEIEGFKRALLEGVKLYDYKFNDLNEDLIVSQILLWWQCRRRG